MKVTIVGADGFLGGRLVPHLAAAGAEVNAVSISAGQGIDAETGILRDEFAIPAGTDAVVYLAQSPFYRQLPERLEHLLQVNVVSAVGVAELARRGGVRRLIYASTGSVYAPAFAPLAEASPVRLDDGYALTKLQAERALALYRGEMGVTIVRPFGIYGPGQKKMIVPGLIGAVADGREVFIERNPTDPADLDGLRISLCYVDDAAEVFARLLSAGPEVVNLAGPEPVSVRRIAREAGSLLGKEPLLKLSDRSRPGDLIADRTLLKTVADFEFTDFATGIAETLRQQAAKESV